MKYNVHMLAYMEGEIREVLIPEEIPSDTNTLLELIFYYGQNDFQPVKGRCSVSVGDVAELDGKFYLCACCGWKELSQEEFKEYKETNRKSRWTFYEHK